MQNFSTLTSTLSDFAKKKNRKKTIKINKWKRLWWKQILFAFLSFAFAKKRNVCFQSNFQTTSAIFPRYFAACLPKKNIIVFIVFQTIGIMLRYFLCLCKYLAAFFNFANSLWFHCGGRVFFMFCCVSRCWRGRIGENSRVHKQR